MSSSFHHRFSRRWYLCALLILLALSACGGGESAPAAVAPVVNTAPVVTAGSDAQAVAKSTVLLNGSATDSGVLQYRWRQQTGPAVTLNNSTQARAEFVAPLIYRTTTLGFELEVTDSAGLSARDSVVITIKPLPMSATEAARLLQQASYGPTAATIAAATGLSAEQWVSQQLVLPATTHADKLQNPPNQDRPAPVSRLETWWKIALTAPDQLRQRLAFAWSEILVVSDQGNGLNNQPVGLANYYDLLLQHGTGNSSSYRQLLEQVTLSPVMGVFLSHLGNEKPDAARNIRPDENYAREVMQLFTIGLVMLEADGRPTLDAKNQTIPTYDQSIIEGFAHVFTGWTSAGTVRFDRPKADYVSPMIAFADFHATGEKKLLNNTILPAGQSAQQDLAQALDNLAGHSNVAPFISKQLIQRLVTSNPSPGYVSRVSAVFANNGQGQRGDLAAVVTAILLDEEARSPDVAASSTFGKLREPLLKTSHLWRLLQSAAPSGRILTYNLADSHAQAPLQSPSVFNFFRPDYSPTTTMQQLGLVAPEQQIVTDSNALNFQNHLYSQTYQSIFELLNNPSQNQMLGQFTPYANILRQQGLPALLDHYALLLLAGEMPLQLRQILTELASGLSSQSAEQQAAAVLYFILISPQYAVQR
jgi:uncharacterized protein (DUF1800 family)